MKYEKPLTLMKARSVKLRISCVKTNWIGVSWKTGVSSFMSNTCMLSGTVVAKPLPSMSRASTVNLYSTIKELVYRYVYAAVIQLFVEH